MKLDKNLSVSYSFFLNYRNIAYLGRDTHKCAMHCIILIPIQSCLWSLEKMFVSQLVATNHCRIYGT